jgi:hypothetical protein
MTNNKMFWQEEDLMEKIEKSIETIAGFAFVITLIYVFSLVVI